MKTAEEKLKEAVEDYTLNKVDYSIQAFQDTEVPALIDLAHDSFENGYRKALTERDKEIIALIDEMMDSLNKEKITARIENDDYDMVACLNKLVALTELKEKLK
jgi:hypothetical protein